MTELMLITSNLLRGGSLAGECKVGTPPGPPPIMPPPIPNPSDGVSALISPVIIPGFTTGAGFVEQAPRRTIPKAEKIIEFLNADMFFLLR
ncbi:MAG: hypothetical protein M0041_01685 [Nitrospiraceae bacterium]|nr:hypothetical protein [Nitrospiraceae bacterium]